MNLFAKIFFHISSPLFVTGLLIAQEIDSLPRVDSLPSQTLGEVVISAN